MSGGFQTIDTAITAPPRRRNKRGVRSRDAVLKAARAEIATGNFQPTAVQIAKAVPCSTRTVFQHFGDIEKLRAAAVEDEATRTAIVVLLVRNIHLGPEDRARLVQAVTRGRA